MVVRWESIHGREKGGWEDQRKGQGGREEEGGEVKSVRERQWGELVT